MEKKSKFKKINDLFRDLVSKSTAIKTFVGNSEEELQNVLSKSNKEADPFLVLFGYNGKLSGNKQHTQGRRSLTFSILYRVTNPNDYAIREQRIDQAEELGLQFIARIKFISDTDITHWLYNSFLPTSVQWEDAFYETAFGLVGCQFTFDIDTKNTMQIDPDSWKDDVKC